jgi:hypothetical protein
VKRYGARKEDHKEYKGLKGTFNTPILVLLKTRNNKDYNFTSLENLQLIESMITSMSAFTLERDPFTLGTKNNMKIYDIQNNIYKSVDYNANYSSDIHIAVLDSFSVTGNSVKTANILCFIDYIHKIPKDIRAINDDEIDAIANVIERQNESKCKILDDYEMLRKIDVISFI